MRSLIRVALCLVTASSCFAAAPPTKPLATPKVKVVFRWVEGERIKGVTEDQGFQATCDPKSIVYPHKKPVMVLALADVTEARLTEVEIAGTKYMVTLHLTKKARERLADACGTRRERQLNIVVDGKRWGVYRYGQGDASIPVVARAETFLPSVGFFSSKAEAKSLADAFD